MDCFEISGPNRLTGRIRAAGAKNAALPALAATLLADGTVELSGLPGVRDIRTMCRLLEHLGTEVEPSSDALRLTPSGTAVAADAEYDLVKTMRASILVLGPLLARLGHARVSLPGGCAIGVRPIDQHLAGLEALGAEVTIDHGYVSARADRLVGNRFRFAVPTVTGTENLLMAACLARGTTVLENCAREPEIVDLARMLSAMGAQIDGAGQSRIEIQGVERLTGARHDIIGDRIEGGTFLLAAAITGGDVTLDNASPADLAPLLEVLAAAGCSVESGTTSVRVVAGGPLQARSIETAPHPGFPTDLQAQFMALATTAEGTSTFSETIFENRLLHAQELVRMGAKIHLEGNRAIVRGPVGLSGAPVMATDLRASVSLVLAGLSAQGTTRVSRVYHLDRGYERMEEKLGALGASVRREAAIA
jgi:UDP-N-acetylglucosamine 1-carboxyvinyltransferase